MKFLISAMLIDSFSYPSSVRPNKTKSFFLSFNFFHTSSTLSGVIMTHSIFCGDNGLGCSIFRWVRFTSCVCTCISFTSFFQKPGNAHPLIKNGNIIRVGKCRTFTIYFTFFFSIDFFFCSFCTCGYF